VLLMLVLVLVLVVIALGALVLLQMVHLARVAFGVGRGDDRRLRGGGVHLGFAANRVNRDENRSRKEI
jgi:hypothetical protein